MKNPFYLNLLWLGIIIIIIGGILLQSCSCGYYYFAFKSRTESIIIGILSSAILLIFAEAINYCYDNKRYSFLKGKYKRTIITQKNEAGLRSSNIPNREEKEKNESIKFIDDSCYHEMRYYKCEQVEYIIKLDYQFHGVYTGFAEYFDHLHGNWRENKMTKIKAKLTLNLNIANKMTGLGSYKYSSRNDFGKYEFQIDEQNNSRIIVQYKSTIPSGLSEGYEIWEKII